MIKVNEITPEHFRCIVGACPAIFQTEDGRILLVGKKAAPQQFGIPETKVGTDEVLIELPRELLEETFDRH